MTHGDWDAPETVTVAAFLNGDGIPYPDADGAKILDDSFLLLFNAYWDTVSFTVSPMLLGTWVIELDSTAADGAGGPGAHNPGDVIPLVGRSLLVLRRPR